jgi:IS5 family transposase
VFVSGQKRGITPTIRRERRCRSAIEPVIGHLKSDGFLGRNVLLGTEGDATNLILAAAGHNLRLLRAWLAWLLARLLCLLGALLQAAVIQHPKARPA